jgi:nucleoside-diphosphate-sugar epimerase
VYGGARHYHHASKREAHFVHNPDHEHNHYYSIPKKAVIITGATAELGGSLIKKSLHDGYHVIACVRDKHKFEQKHPIRHRHLKVVGISTQGAIDPNTWEQIAKEAAKSHHFVGVINTIGGAVAPKGHTLDDINSRPAVASAIGLRKALSFSGAEGAYVNFSSIVPSIIPEHEYGQARAKADEQVMAEAGAPAIALRPGLVYTDMDENRIDNGHAFSPEQLAKLPVKFIIGSGKQKMQPVYAGDMVLAAVNSLDSKESKIINAVGQEVVSQGQLFDFFHDLVNPGTSRHLRISTRIMKVMAQHVPHGRLAPYSVAVFAHLDENPSAGVFPWQPFAKAIGKKPATMSSVYHKDIHRHLVVAKPPLLEYTVKVAHALFSSSEFRRDLSHAAVADIHDKFFVRSKPVTP